MKQGDQDRERNARIRSQAEESFRRRFSGLEDVSILSQSEVDRLVHELKVHQIELELQNEELRRLQDALSESRDKYADLYDFAPVGYFTLDKQGLILEVNLTGVALVTADRSFLLGKPFQRLLDKEYVDQFFHFKEEVVSTRMRRQCEVQLHRFDGTPIYAQLDAAALEDGEGRTTGIRMIVSDISERKVMERQLLQARKMEAIGTLAVGIAHDFNNMLQVILGYADMLLLGKENGQPGYQELQQIVKTSYDARDLVQKIRILSRKADMKPVPLDLNHNIDQVYKLLSHTLPRTIHTRIHLAEDLAIMNADSDLMNQMVMNLAINGSEAMPDGGTLTIETENAELNDDFCQRHLGLEPGPHVLLTVSDTGRGIEKELLDKICDPFYSTKPRDYHKGTGLGLPVVQGIVEQHKGYLSVESEVGSGTTVRIYFPALENAKAAKTVEEIPLPRGGTETILLVEDEEILRNLGRDVLEQFGYKVLPVGDGQEAVEVYEREQGDISLVILDIMPRMDGKQCLREFLRINPTVKVLISSGIAEEDLIENVVNLGAKGSLNKPFNVRALLQEVRKVLDTD
ncbi:MAG: two-component system, cell cycle sensor histidine kinase and response regulator CckA [Thermodesulfobacteriota bacterium]|nr:two-component system, cell cycle sensor histidine kinase and response regulator CckA [Thermodesulfobacteriota bacterium]